MSSRLPGSDSVRHARSIFPDVVAQVPRSVRPVRINWIKRIHHCCHYKRSSSCELLIRRRSWLFRFHQTSLLLDRATMPSLGQIICITFQGGIRQSQASQIGPASLFSPLVRTGETPHGEEDIFFLFRPLFSNSSDFRLVGALPRTFSDETKR